MDRIKGWVVHLGFAAVMAGALLSRDACFGGSKRPDPPPPQSAAPAQSAAPTSTQSFAAPP